MSDPDPNSEYAHDGTRLRALIARRGMSHAEFAEAAGVSLQSVLTVWIGQGKIARARIPMICDLLNCSADELLGLRTLARPSQVAEALSTYRSLSADARALLDAFDRMPPQNRTHLLGIAKALTQSDKPIPRAPSGMTIHKSLPCKSRSGRL